MSYTEKTEELIDVPNMTLSQEEEKQLSDITNRANQRERRRHKALQKKLRDEILTDEEGRKLVCLSEKIESVEVDRLEFLASVADSRKVSLRSLMEVLDIKSPSYV